MIIAINGDSIAQNYQWPLKIKPKLSSHFGDSRAGHWHSGIDITTRGRPGYKVYAVSDGYIYRVRTSFWGYGKALYLKLNDGRFAVYGHLQRFSLKLKEKVREIQIKEKEYYQDIYFKPGQYPVKKGDYIALTGQTGAGSPHLHFEIRNDNGLPVNPLKGFYNLSDSRPPVVDYLVVKRFKKYGHANYHDTEFLKLKGFDPNLFVSDTIAVDGQAVFAVSAYDPNGGYNYGLHKASLILDDSVIFNFEKNSFDYETGDQISYVQDLELKKLIERFKGVKDDYDKNVFYRLYIQPDDNQLLYGGFTYPAGIIDSKALSSGVHKLNIELYDEKDNRCNIQLYLRRTEFDKPELVEIKSESSESIYILGAFPADYKPQLQGRYSHYLPYVSMPSEFSMFNRELKFKTSPDIYDYRLRTVDKYSSFSPWINISPQIGSTGINLFADYLEVVVPDDSDFLVNPSENRLLYSEVIPQNDNFTKLIIPAAYQDGYFEPEWFSNLSLDGCYVFNNSGTAYSPDSSVRISPDRDKLYGTAVIQITEPVPDGSDGYSFEILPENLLFKKELEIEIDNSRLSLDTKYTSMYYYSEKKDKWFYISVDSPVKIKGETAGGGKFGLLVDNVPPKINRIRPRRNSRIKSKTPLLSCRVVDDLSSFNTETQLEMTIDGIWVPAHYDIDNAVFYYQVKNPLKSGQHKLRITAIDNQGNKAVVNSRFSITGRN